MEREVFLVEGEGRVVLFAPMMGLIIEVHDDEKEEINALINQPQFSFQNLMEVFPEIAKDRLLSREEEQAPTEEERGVFLPDSAVLFTTLDCSLRCIYCYATAGENKMNMSQEIAKATIDFIIRNAKTQGREKCFLEFHGGGEPTHNWPVFQFALVYFQEQSRKNNLVSQVGLATNGMLSREQVDWISQHMQKVQVSLDGMGEIQNFQRPTAGNGKSFVVVYRTVALLLAKEVQVIIHSVVTEKGIARIPEIVHFFADNFPGTTVHLEPAYSCGRGLITGQRFPSAELFVKGFIEAQEIARSHRVELFYSGTTPRLTECRKIFCGVSQPNFVVTPTGLVTACHEIAEIGHPFAQYFIYGYLDRLTGHFVFDHQKIRNLRSYATEIDPRCEECFARFCCAGDCLAKCLNGRGERTAPFTNPRCEINRELTKHHIFNRIVAEKEVNHGVASGREERPGKQ